MKRGITVVPTNTNANHIKDSYEDFLGEKGKIFPKNSTSKKKITPAIDYSALRLFLGMFKKDDYFDPNKTHCRAFVYGILNLRANLPQEQIIDGSKIAISSFKEIINYLEKTQKSKAFNPKRIINNQRRKNLACLAIKYSRNSLIFNNHNEDKILIENILYLENELFFLAHSINKRILTRPIPTFEEEKTSLSNLSEKLAQTTIGFNQIMIRNRNNMLNELYKLSKNKPLNKEVINKNEAVRVELISSIAISTGKTFEEIDEISQRFIRINSLEIPQTQKEEERMRIYNELNSNSICYQPLFLEGDIRENLASMFPNISFSSSQVCSTISNIPSVEEFQEQRKKDIAPFLEMVPKDMNLYKVIANLHHVFLNKSEVLFETIISQIKDVKEEEMTFLKDIILQKNNNPEQQNELLQQREPALQEQQEFTQTQISKLTSLYTAIDSTRKIQLMDDEFFSLHEKQEISLEHLQTCMDVFNSKILQQEEVNTDVLEQQHQII
jgi:hypothetical protein